MADLPVRAISIALIYVGHLWTGIRRRRPYWKVGAWCRFAALFLLGVLALAVSLRMARGVDEGVYEGMTPWQHDVYLYTMFALLLGGLTATAGGILWLAYGDAERELGRRRVRGPTTFGPQRRLTYAAPDGRPRTARSAVEPR